MTPEVEVAPHFTELSDGAVDDFGSFWSLCVIIFIHVISFGYEGDKCFLEVFMITVEAPAMLYKNEYLMSRIFRKLFHIKNSMKLVLLL